MKPILHYYDLGPHLTAFSTTREGGFSEGSYGQLNVNPYCGDQPGAVARNRQLLAQELMLASASRLLYPHQVHGDVVRQIDSHFLCEEQGVQAEWLEGVDALMTDQLNVCIGVSTADCIPLIIYDPEHHAAAVVHAGWRGTVKRIAQKTVELMKARYQSDAAGLKAVIGPGISLRNFEVGQEVYDEFRNNGFFMEEIASFLPASDTLSPGKWHIDLPYCNRLQLEEAGILSAHVYDCGICTYDHNDQFFSARRQGIHSGRILTGIVLR